jgi:sugar lactone lactonase YvrE
VRRLVVVSLVVSVVGWALPAGGHTGGPVGGFENPESVVWDGATGSFYVSNMGPGAIDRRDPDGYVSKLSSSGRRAVAKWVTGLRSPKGMRRRGGDLLVVDVGQLVVIDVAREKIRDTIDLDRLGALFPNDVAVYELTGDAYVSDTARNAIYRIPSAGGAPEVWLESEALDGPNGLFIDGHHLVVASSGTDPDGRGPAGRSPGRILVVDLATKQVSALGDMAPLGNLDGIEKLDADWIVSGSGKVWRVTADGRAAEIAAIEQAADLGLRRGDRVVAVPTRSGNTVEFLTVP